MSPATEMSLPKASFCIFCTQFIKSSKILLTTPDGSAKEHIWEEHAHHSDLKSLHASAWAGCHLCSYFSIEDWRFRLPVLLAECVASHEPEPGCASADLKISLSAQPIYVLFQLRLANSPYNSLSLVDRTLASYAKDAEEAAKANALLPPAPSSRRTDSDECFAVAAHWLKSCQADHVECNAQESFSQSQSPARLIDVGSQEADVIRVADKIPNTFPEERPKYLTLSHCWGTKKLFQLTTINRQELQEGIQISRLPQTFQDAITATRKLGYRFLWIDSLCILQDSKEDWLRESIKMANIYGSSDLTLAALSARDSSEGLFKDRNPLCNVPLILDNGLEVSGYKTWEEEYDSPAALLNTRAWVFQELVASPRTLSYGASGIYWQCFRTEATERNIGGSTHNGSSQFRAKGKLQTLLSPLKDAYATWHFLFYWNEFIEFYTKRALTFHSDKLAAISGLTSLLEARHSLTLYAGLWKEFLLDQLLWEADTPQSGPKSNLFPSWSWASISSKIESHHHQIMFPDLHGSSDGPNWLTEFLPSNKHNDNGGQSPRILLRAPMRRAVFRRGCTYKLRTSKGASWHDDGSTRFELAHAAQPDLWVSEFFPDTVIAEDTEIWCLRVVKSREDSGVRSWMKSPKGIGASSLPRRWVVEGLVVARREAGEDVADGDFVRVGKFLYDMRPEELDQSGGWGRGGRKWDASLWHSEREMDLIERGWERREVRLW